MTEDERRELKRRLRYIIHCGFIEVRNLAGVPGASEQIHDLADAMEILPRYLEGPTDEDLEMIRFVLTDYHTRHPHSRDYMKYLECYEVPERY